MGDQGAADQASASRPSLEMQVLQLECIIAAKDREMQLLRQRLAEDQEVRACGRVHGVLCRVHACPCVRVWGSANAMRT
jgi:hypothetical protein